MARHQWGRAATAAGFSALVVAASCVGAAGASASSSRPASSALVRAPGRPQIDPWVAPHTGLRNTAGIAGAHLQYFGGRVLSNVHVVQVLWGTGSYDPAVTGTGPGTLSGMYQQITNSPYFDWLTEYNTIGFGFGTNQQIGRGHFDGQVTIAPSTSDTTLDDLTIQAELAKQFAAGKLPAPTVDAAGNSNTYYALFVPAGIDIVSGGTTSCKSGGFVAYHNTIANVSGVGEIYYGVHPDIRFGDCAVGAGPGTPTQNEMSAASHELVETVTDPEVGLAPSIGPPLAWYDPQGQNGEIGDICNQQDATIAGSDGAVYTVQQQWSNVANDCIVTRPLGNDFSIGVSQPSVAMTLGTSAQETINTATSMGVAQGVSLAVSGLPGNVTASLAQSSVTSGQSTTLTLATQANTTQTGTFTVVVTGTGSQASHASNFTLTVTGNGALLIGPATLPVATFAQPYTVTLTASGGVAPYPWGHGRLPKGLRFNAKTGLISGTPKAVGTFTVLLKLADSSKPRTKITALATLTILFPS